MDLKIHHREMLALTTKRGSYDFVVRKSGFLYKGSGMHDNRFLNSTSERLKTMKKCLQNFLGKIISKIKIRHPAKFSIQC